MLDDTALDILSSVDRPIVITGGGGWLGLATLDLLERSLGERFPERVHCFGSQSRSLDLGDGRFVRQRALAELAELKGSGAWVFHYAFQTKDKAEAMDEAAYRGINLAIRDTVLDALDRIDAAGVFVASSGAALKADDPAASPAMRLYGAMKRDDEQAFATWAEQRQRRAVIGRIFNITGPYINKHHAYAMASFILDGLAGRCIAVRAPRPVIRSYVAIRELISLILALLFDPSAPDAVTRFDTGGEPLELGAVADVVARILGSPGVERAPITDPSADHYVGDVAAYAGLLARYGVTPISLDQQIVETASFLGSGAEQVPR